MNGPVPTGAWFNDGSSVAAIMYASEGTLPN